MIRQRGFQINIRDWGRGWYSLDREASPTRKLILNRHLAPYSIFLKGFYNESLTKELPFYDFHYSDVCMTRSVTEDHSEMCATATIRENGLAVNDMHFRERSRPNWIGQAYETVAESALIKGDYHWMRSDSTSYAVRRNVSSGRYMHENQFYEEHSVGRMIRFFWPQVWLQLKDAERSLLLDKRFQSTALRESASASMSPRNRTACHSLHSAVGEKVADQFSHSGNEFKTLELPKSAAVKRLKYLQSLFAKWIPLIGGEIGVPADSVEDEKLRDGTFSQRSEPDDLFRKEDQLSYAALRRLSRAVHQVQMEEISIRNNVYGITGNVSAVRDKIETSFHKSQHEQKLRQANNHSSWYEFQPADLPASHKEDLENALIPRVTRKDAHNRDFFKTKSFYVEDGELGSLAPLMFNIGNSMWGLVRGYVHDVLQNEVCSVPNMREEETYGGQTKDEEKYVSEVAKLWDANHTGQNTTAMVTDEGCLKSQESVESRHVNPMKNPMMQFVEMCSVNKVDKAPVSTASPLLVDEETMFVMVGPNKVAQVPITSHFEMHGKISVLRFLWNEITESGLVDLPGFSGVLPTKSTASTVTGKRDSNSSMSKEGVREDHSKKYSMSVATKGSVRYNLGTSRGFPGLVIPKKMAPAKIVDVDVDLTMSTFQVLDWMFGNRLILPGTVIGYDDWWNIGCAPNILKMGWELLDVLSSKQRGLVVATNSATNASAGDLRTLANPHNPNAIELERKLLGLANAWREELIQEDTALYRLANLGDSVGGRVSENGYDNSTTSTFREGPPQNTNSPYIFPPFHPFAWGEGRAHLAITQKYKVKWRCLAGSCVAPERNTGCSRYDDRGMSEPIFVVVDYDLVSDVDRVESVQDGSDSYSTADHGFDFRVEEVARYLARIPNCAMERKRKIGALTEREKFERAYFEPS